MNDLIDNSKIVSKKPKSLKVRMHISALLTYALALILVSANSANAGWLGGPDNYNDCVIENTKSVTLQNAVKQIEKACSDKFSVALKQDQISKISGTAKILIFNPFLEYMEESQLAKKQEQGTPFVFTFYNGLRQIHILEIDVQIKFNADITRVYKLEVEVSPLSEGEFKRAISTTTYDSFDDWGIVSAKGLIKN